MVVSVVCKKSMVSVAVEVYVSPVYVAVLTVPYNDVTVANVGVVTAVSTPPTVIVGVIAVLVYTVEYWTQSVMLHESQKR